MGLTSSSVHGPHRYIHPTDGHAALHPGPARHALTRASCSGAPVEIDLGGVDFIDGSGLSALMQAESRARRGRRQLTIVAASRNVRRLIEFTGTADRVSPLTEASGAAGACP